MSTSFIPNSNVMPPAVFTPGVARSGTPAIAPAPVFVPEAGIPSSVASDSLVVEQKLSQVNPPESVQVWGTDFARLTMSETVDFADRIVKHRQPQYFITANLNYMMLTDRDRRLKNVNREAAAVLADGYPIVMRSRCGINPLPERVAGADLVIELGKLSAAEGHRIYFLGAAPGVADAAATELRRLCPGIHIAGCYSPPFRPLNEAENKAMLDNIQLAKTDILLVAFGQPKGELWIHQHYQQLRVPLSIQIGASFDFLAGTAERAPQLVQQVGAEWLYRTLLEPKRLAPRYAGNICYLARTLAKDVKSLLK